MTACVVSVKSDGYNDKAWKKCEKESKSVEVVYKNAEGEENLTRVHFRFNPKVILNFGSYIHRIFVRAESPPIHVSEVHLYQ